MKAPTDAARLPVTRDWAASERAVTSIMLALALAGLALPYGTTTPGTDGDLTVTEWIVSGLAALAAVALLVDLLRPLHPRWRISGMGFIAAAVVFSTAGWYVLFHMTELGTLAAIAQAASHFAWAGIAGFEWRRMAIARKGASDG